MFLFNYTVESGHDSSCWDYSHSHYSETAIICGDAFTAKGLRSIVSNLDVFNILMAQGSLSKLCEIFGGNVSLEMMSYVASIGPAFSSRDVEEFYLDAQYKNWVGEKKMATTQSINQKKSEWIYSLIQEIGFDATVEKLTNSDKFEIEKAVKRHQLACEKMFFDFDLPEEMREGVVEFSQVKAILECSANCDKFSLIPTDEELTKELKKWESEYIRLSTSSEEEDWEYYETIDVSLRPLVLPEEGVVVINKDSSVSYYND